MCLKNLIALVVTTVAFAGSLANASVAQFAAKSHMISDNVYTRLFAANIMAEDGADNATVEPSQPAITDAKADASNAAEAPSQPVNTDVKAGAGNAAEAPSQLPQTDENTGAGNAPAAPSQPSKTNENISVGNVAAAPSQPSKTNENTGAGNVAATPSQPAAPNANPAGNSEDGSSATNGGTEQRETYHHNTSIYKDDGSLWRVEYYDDNNRLCEYSDVDGYDKDTHSYTETVYRYDEENDVEIPVRTDTYVNGELVSSVYY